MFKILSNNGKFCVTKRHGADPNPGALPESLFNNDALIRIQVFSCLCLFLFFYGGNPNPDCCQYFISIWGQGPF
jgi:hypothetical protein